MKRLVALSRLPCFALVSPREFIIAPPLCAMARRRRPAHKRRVTKRPLGRSSDKFPLSAAKQNAGRPFTFARQAMRPTRCRDAAGPGRWRAPSSFHRRVFDASSNCNVTR